jgi:CRP-like cAMP-binding protein
MNPVLAKLNLHSPQTTESEAAVQAIISGHTRKIDRRRDLFRAGDRPQSGFIVLDGWALRHKSLGDGRSQVTALLLPGDIFDLHTYLAREVDDTVTAVTPFKVAILSKADFEHLTETYPCLTKALLWEELVETAVDREWVLNVGRRNGYERLAHLLCEIVIRIRMVGLGNAEHIHFPLTQAQLAEMTGQTPVHVNRVLKALWNEGLITLVRRTLAVHDLKGLMKRAFFEPGYLHLEWSEAALIGTQ